MCRFDMKYSTEEPTSQHGECRKEEHGQPSRPSLFSVVPFPSAEAVQRGIAAAIFGSSDGLDSGSDPFIPIFL